MRGCAYGRGSAFANKVSSVETRPVHVNMGVCVHDMVHAWSTDGARGHKAVHIGTWWCMWEHDGGMRAQGCACGYPECGYEAVHADTKRCMSTVRWMCEQGSVCGRISACGRCSGCRGRATHVEVEMHLDEADGADNAVLLDTRR